jgi:membrane fusion protein (multidrug efflux system)
MSPDSTAPPPEPGAEAHHDAPAHAPAQDRPVPRARTRRMIGIGIGLLGLFAILLAAGATPRLRNARALDAASQTVRSSVPGVTIVRPVPADNTGLSLAATTQAIQDAVIYARTSGYISKRHVDIGDHVKAGQLIAEIESPEIDEQLRQARAQLVQSEKTLDLQKASLELAQVTMGRYKAADAEKAVAIEAVDQSISTFRTAQASVAAAQATIDSNVANVRHFEQLTSFERVLAPFSGTVIQRNVDVGALITAGSPTDNTAVAPSSVSGAPNGLFEIANLDMLRVFVNVPQAYAPNVHVGLPVEVAARGHLAEPIVASVTRTASAIDPGTRTLLTEVDIPNRSHAMPPGMFVFVNFKIGVSGTHWRLPATAGIFDAKGTRVAIVLPEKNTIHFQPVEMGRDLGASIDIQSGLHGHEAVVAQPTVSLQEGQVVRPIESPAKP